MDSQHALAVLRQHERELRARGVCHAAVFGSVARGENRYDSDIDIMIDTEPEARITIFDYVGIKEFIATLFDGQVDVVKRDALKPHLRRAANLDAIYAF